MVQGSAARKRNGGTWGRSMSGGMVYGWVGQGGWDNAQSRRDGKWDLLYKSSEGAH